MKWCRRKKNERKSRQRYWPTQNFLFSSVPRFLVTLDRSNATFIGGIKRSLNLSLDAVDTKKGPLFDLPWIRQMWNWALAIETMKYFSVLAQLFFLRACSPLREKGEKSLLENMCVMLNFLSTGVNRMEKVIFMLCCHFGRGRKKNRRKMTVGGGEKFFRRQCWKSLLFFGKENILIFYFREN